MTGDKIAPSMRVSPTISTSVTSAAFDSSEPEISVILPTLNERENLPCLVEQIEQLQLPSYEIVVVDDGSTDGTQELLTRCARESSRIRPILNKVRQTLTVAHLQGILASQGKFVVVMDSDLQHPSESIPEMLHHLRNGSDLVIGSRYSHDGSVGGRPALRGVMSRCATLVAKALLPEARGISDPISGFFGFRRSIFQPYDRRYRGYETILFMLVMCRGRSISEFGYEFRSRSSGSSQIVQDLGFIRVFLTQLVLAERFRQSLWGRRGPSPSSEPRAVGSQASAEIQSASRSARER